MEEKQTIFEDLKKIKGYILGVIAFATAVSVFFTQVLNLPIQPVLATMFIATICMLFIGFLIEKSEERTNCGIFPNRRDCEVYFYRHRRRKL